MRERLRGLGGLPKWVVVASVLGVGAFALGQPLLDLLGRNPEFFIARRFPGPDIAILAVALLILPALLAGVVLVLRLAGPFVSGSALLAVIGLAGGTLASVVLVALGAGDLPLLGFVALAVGAGGLLAWMYTRYRGVRTLLAYLGLAPVVIGLWFAFGTPMSQLLFGSTANVPEAVAVGNPVPVVMVVLDELPLATVMLPDGSLNEARYPNLARIAGDGTWYRDAVGIRQQTEEAIPAILTGRAVPPGRIPTTADYPFTLFSLLSAEYDVAAVENVTELCPTFICSNVSRPVEPPADRWTSVVSDLSVVYAHLSLPSALTGDLPRVDQGWTGFRAQGDGGYDIIQRFLDEVSNDRRNEVARFIDTLGDPGDDPPLRFAHLLFPHHPWELTADGRRHGATGSPGSTGGGWGADEFLVAQGWQRHLIQAEWTDAVLGRVIEELEATGIYDEALIVVVADHGITIRPGVKHQRVATEETVGSIAAVPLIVKYPSAGGPFPDPGTVDDTRAETIDLLPTMADVLDVTVPWSVDGVSLLDEGTRAQREGSVMMGNKGAVDIPLGTDALMEVVSAQNALFPGGDPYLLTPEGWGDLLGRIGVESEDVDGVSVVVNQAEAIASHVPGSDPVPSFLSGTVEVVGASGEETLAVVVDGTVVAVTRSFEVEGTTARWHAMVHPDVIDRADTVEVWQLTGSVESPSFRR